MLFERKIETVSWTVAVMFTLVIAQQELLQRCPLEWEGVKYDGVCVKLISCPTAMQIIRNKNATVKSILFLKAIHCGFEDTLPKVCCLLRSYYNNSTDAITFNTTEPQIVMRPRETVTPPSPTTPITPMTITEPPSITSAPPRSTTTTRRPSNNHKIVGTHKTTPAPAPVDNWADYLDTSIPSTQHDKIIPSPVDGFSILPNRTICGRGAGTDRIYGGSLTTIDEFPWMALIKQEQTDTLEISLSCGGTLFTDRHVLTAAHCFSIPRSRAVAVRLGDWNLGENPDCNDDYGCAAPYVEKPIKKIIEHPEFHNRNDRFKDIAIVEMTESVTFTDTIKPICLPTTASLKSKDNDNSRYVVAGWGKTEYGQRSNVLKKVDVYSVNAMTCQGIRIYAQVKSKDWSKIICAGGEKTKDACQGDSGGPLASEVSDKGVISWVLYGIVSTGPSPCGQDIPSLYTRVTTYMDWIRSVLQSYIITEINKI